MFERRLGLAAVSRHQLYTGSVCNGIARGDAFVESPHALLQSRQVHVEVGGRLFEALVPEQVLDVV
jgi:hypothetical protein